MQEPREAWSRRPTSFVLPIRAAAQKRFLGCVDGTKVWIDLALIDQLRENIRVQLLLSYQLHQKRTGQFVNIGACESMS